MRGEIIAIGDELITGQRLDTNTQWLAERLTECGVVIAFHTTIGDHLADNVAAFRVAIDRADVVVSTGGLGPTADDLTREAIAAAAGVGLVRHEPSLEHIKRLFATRGRTMPARNEVQADLPDGAEPIENEHGTAPGIQLRIERPGRTPCMVFALPGVPAEMKPMWSDTVAPAVRLGIGAPQLIRHRRIKCFGAGESQLEAMLPDLIRRGRDPSVGITVSDATITLRITAAAANDEDFETAIAPTVAIIRESLGSLVFGEEDEELEDVVAQMLAREGKTLAVAEIATAGLIAQWLAGTATAPNPLALDVSAVSAEGLLRVLPYTPDERASVCGLIGHESAFAEFAAAAVRRAAAADFGLAVAAFPPESEGPDARIHLAIASYDGTRRLRFSSASHPAIRRPRAAKQALNALRLALSKGQIDQ